MLSFTTHGDVRDISRRRLPLSPSGSPLAFPSVLHPHAALKTLKEYMSKPCRHLHEILHCAETCMTSYNDLMPGPHMIT
jgi:hypothetical protein